MCYLKIIKKKREFLNKKKEKRKEKLSNLNAVSDSVDSIPNHLAPPLWRRATI